MKKTAAGYRLIFGYVGIFLILIGIICLLPLLVLPFYPNEVGVAFNFYVVGGERCCRFASVNCAPARPR